MVMFISSLLVPLVALGARVLAVPTVSNATHDLSGSTTYDLTRSGAGGHSIGPPNLFTHLDARGTPKHSRDLAASGPSPYYDYPNFGQNCFRYQAQYVIDSLVFAREYITAALEYVEGRNDKAIYVRWFGTYTSTRADHLAQSLTRLRNEQIVDHLFDCDCDDRHRPLWYEPHARTLHLCTGFWDAARVGPWPSRALALVMGGMSRWHAIVDNAVTAGACERLARRSPNLALDNPPNYMEFIRSVSRLSRGVGTPFVI